MALPASSTQNVNRRRDRVRGGFFDHPTQRKRYGDMADSRNEDVGLLTDKGTISPTPGGDVVREIPIPDQAVIIGLEFLHRETVSDGDRTPTNDLVWSILYRGRPLVRGFALSVPGAVEGEFVTAFPESDRLKIPLHLVGGAKMVVRLRNLHPTDDRFYLFGLVVHLLWGAEKTEQYFLSTEDDFDGSLHVG
ncbi:MAG: hypothetical protein HY719_10190 [Planctomycetes bacterium]|nr:hypothetical protein [Planctomycetota bacterium]